MIIAIGSTNRVKVLAVTEVIRDFSIFAEAKIFSYASPSDVPDQPLSLQTTIQGAKNRAKNAFQECQGCHYSFGIEGGIMEADGTKTGFLITTVCCIYDGVHYYTGLSMGFEIPRRLIDLILEKKMDLSQACLHQGITSNTMLGSTEGIIGILTKGRIDRKEYSKQSIVSALLQLENTHLYS